MPLAQVWQLESIFAIHLPKVRHILILDSAGLLAGVIYPEMNERSLQIKRYILRLQYARQDYCPILTITSAPGYSLAGGGHVIGKAVVSPIVLVIHKSQRELLDLSRLIRDLVFDKLNNRGVHRQTQIPYEVANEYERIGIADNERPER